MYAYEKRLLKVKHFYRLRCVESAIKSNCDSQTDADNSQLALCRLFTLFRMKHLWKNHKNRPKLKKFVAHMYRHLTVCVCVCVRQLYVLNIYFSTVYFIRYIHICAEVCMYCILCSKLFVTLRKKYTKTWTFAIRVWMKSLYLNTAAMLGQQRKINRCALWSHHNNCIPSDQK